MDFKKINHSSILQYLSRFALIGFFFNSIWVLSIFVGINELSFLGFFFNTKPQGSFLNIVLKNLISFNWVYMFIWLACSFVKLLYLVCLCLYNFTTTNLTGLFVGFFKIYPFFNMGAYVTVESFWLLLKNSFNSLNFDDIRYYFSGLCPVNLYNHIYGYINSKTSNYKINLAFFDVVKDALLDVNFFFLFSFALFVFSTLASFLLLSYLGLYGVFILNLITIFFFWLNSISKINYFLVSGNSIHVVIGKWFTLWGFSPINFEFYFDSLSFSYLLLTLSIAVFVFIFTFSYFRYEPNVERLLLFINLFVISMLILVSSGNIFVFFLGWELIGLTSFFLINFWSTRVGTLKAAFKAMTFNKVSDVSLFISLMLIYHTTNDCNIQTINNQVVSYQNLMLHFWNYEVSYVEFLSFFMLLAAFIKSAQFGTHIWLPDSMEAPVPASALIHSATLVSAGVFLVLRFYNIFELSVYAKYVMMFVGGFTAFFGGWCAVFQSDIKKILAYSTLSHCGFLILTCSYKVPEVTVFYLYVHGFFKACVFLCVGNIIRFSNNYQDIRRMGMFWKFLPFESFCVLICLLNLAGLPFTLGFFIKHYMFSSLTPDLSVYFILFLVVSAAFSGLFYSAKLYYYVFFDFKKGKKFTYYHFNNSNLKSDYFSATTLASNIAITSLLVVGYFISSYLYYNLTSKLNVTESFDLLYSESSNFYNYGWSLNSFLNFSSAVNWVFLQSIMTIILPVWRRTFSPYNIIDTLFFLAYSCIFFYIIICGGI